MQKSSEAQASLRKISLSIFNAKPIALQPGLKKDFMHLIRGLIMQSNVTLQHLLQGTMTQMFPKARTAKTRPQIRDKMMPRSVLRTMYKIHFDHL